MCSPVRAYLLYNSIYALRVSQLFNGFHFAYLHAVLHTDVIHFALYCFSTLNMSNMLLVKS